MHDYIYSGTVARRFLRHRVETTVSSVLLVESSSLVESYNERSTLFLSLEYERYLQHIHIAFHHAQCYRDYKARTKPKVNKRTAK